MSETLTVAPGPVVEVAGNALAFSTPAPIWPGGDRDNAWRAPEVPGLLLVLVEDRKGTLVARLGGEATSRKFRLVNVFDVECLAKPEIDALLVERARAEAPAGTRLFGAYREFADPARRREAVSSLRDVFDLGAPPEIHDLMALPPSRRAAILRHYPVDVDMAEHKLWEAVDDSISHIDD